MDARPIGFFDSGVGGLSILRATRRLLPQESMVYLADSEHFPYGVRSPSELCALATTIVERLLALRVKLVVVACNTASVATLSHLRATFPDIPFVGVVPVVKTLAHATRTGTVALLSTPATAQSAYLAGLIAEFAAGRRVITVECEGLADLVECGEAGTARTQALLEAYLQPIRESDADVVGLGCTHYPFLRRQIKAVLGPTIRVYDSGEPVARRVRWLLDERDALADHAQPDYHLYTTGDPQAFVATVGSLLRLPARSTMGVLP